jgi:hypothetical protein
MIGILNECLFSFFPQFERHFVKTLYFSICRNTTVGYFLPKLNSFRKRWFYKGNKSEAKFYTPKIAEVREDLLLYLIEVIIIILFVSLKKLIREWLRKEDYSFLNFLTLCCHHYQCSQSFHCDIINFLVLA